MRVRATQNGYFGGVFRQPGTITEEFTVDTPEAFSDMWMEALDPPAPAAPVKAAPAAAPVAPVKADAEKL